MGSHLRTEEDVGREEKPIGEGSGIFGFIKIQ